MKTRFATALAVLLAATSLASAQPDLIAPPSIDFSEGDPDSSFRIWGYGEYLLWKVTGPSVPLVTANTSTIMTIDPAGALPVDLGVVVGVTAGVPNGPGLEYGYSSGFRTGLGYWFDNEQTLGADIHFHYLPSESVEFVNQVTNLGGQNFPTGLTDVVLVSPGPPPVTTSTPILVQTLPGSRVTLSGNVENRFWGLEANARSGGYGVPGLLFDFLVGFRHANFRETLRNHEDIDVTFQDSVPGGPIIPLKNILDDEIRASNRFYGAQIGTVMDCWLGPVFAGGSIKLAVGCMNEEVALSGTNTATGAGGLLVSALDNGKTFSRDRLAFIPEFNAKVGIRFWQYARAYVGYNWMFISSVARPGDQIAFAATQTNMTVGTTTVPITVNTPAFRFTDSSLWYQGANFGVEFRY